jgi:hypothetical protein
MLVEEYEQLHTVQHTALTHAYQHQCLFYGRSQLLHSLVAFIFVLFEI